jgi:hypothetical protein
LPTTLTKVRALELTRNMWDWLSENSLKDKQDWPGYKPALKELGIEDAIHYCFLCEYTRTSKWQNCEVCPLKDYFIKGIPKRDLDPAALCETEGSAWGRFKYYAYDITSSRWASHWARKIADYSRKALEALKDE